MKSSFSLKKPVIVLIIIIIAGFFFLKLGWNETQEGEIFDQIREVKVASISEISAETPPLPILGSVQSVNRAIIKTESSGQITSVSKQLGDTVRAGEIIAQIENRTQQAQVKQAKGLLDTAQANFLKVTIGAQDEVLGTLESRAEVSGRALDEAKVSTEATLSNAYAKGDDAVRNQVDQLFINPRSSSPSLVFILGDFFLETKIIEGRRSIESTLLTWKKEVDSLLSLKEVTKDELFSALDTATINTQKIRDFLDDVAQAVNKLNSTSSQTDTTYALWRANISGARSSVSLSASSISQANDNLSGKISANDIAQNNLLRGELGGTSEEVQAAQGAFTQAQGVYQGALQGLEKTVIRTPISGTLNELSVERGDFVNAFSSAAIVANNNALEVSAFVTEEDRAFLVTGSKVLVANSFAGVITRIGTALDSETKKIEITIGIVSSNATLINGQSVELSIARVPRTDIEPRVPISALKIQSDGAVVFSVNDESVLVKHSVEIGPLIGGHVFIRSGFDYDLPIVLDARGLKEGQEVFISR